MTDLEIIEKLKEANALLEKYKEVVKPVAIELARLKSLAVYGREGCYLGELGCFESGADCICLHIKDDARGENWEADRPFHDKAMNFDMEWSRKAHEAGIQNVYISGHF